MPQMHLPMTLERMFEEREKEVGSNSSDHSPTLSEGNDSSSSDESDSSDDTDFNGSDDGSDDHHMDKHIPFLPPRHRRTQPLTQAQAASSGPSTSNMGSCRSRRQTSSTIVATPSLTTPALLESIAAQRELNEWRRRALVAEGKALVLQAERDAATVHAVLAGQEAAVFKYRLNSHDKRKDGSKCFATDARIVTSREGKRQAKEEAAKKAAKKKADDDRTQKRKDVEWDDIIRHAAQEKDGTAFLGTIKSKSKRELQDILFALGLAADGTIPVLKIRINAHFEATPLLKEDPCYVGLFSTTRKRKRRVDDDAENEQPHRCHSPDFPPSPGPSFSSPPPPPRTRPRPIPHRPSASPRPFGPQSGAERFGRQFGAASNSGAPGPPIPYPLYGRGPFELPSSPSHTNTLYLPLYSHRMLSHPGSSCS